MQNYEVSGVKLSSGFEEFVWNDKPILAQVQVQVSYLNLSLYAVKSTSVESGCCKNAVLTLNTLKYLF